MQPWGALLMKMIQYRSSAYPDQLELLTLRRGMGRGEEETSLSNGHSELCEVNFRYCPGGDTEGPLPLVQWNPGVTYPAQCRTGKLSFVVMVDPSHKH